MPPVESPEAEVPLHDPRAIEVLLDARQRQAFLPFVGAPTTVKRAALLAGETPNTTLSRVNRWTKLGLLKVTGEQRHARGTSIEYQASAEAYWVAYRSTPAESLVQLARAVYAPMFERVVHNYARVGAGLSDEWGLVFQPRGRAWFIRPTQAVACRCSPLDDDLPPALLEMESFRLSAAQAKRLQRDLAALLLQYRELSDDTGDVYDVLLGLAPHEKGPPTD